MATRFGVRLPDLRFNLNSPYFFRNIAFYRKIDHYEEQQTYLSPVADAVNTHAVLEVSSDARMTDGGRAEVGVRTKVCLPCTNPATGATMQFLATEGGDAAWGNAAAGLRSCAVAGGSCRCCEAPKGPGWFNPIVYENAIRRTTWRSLLLAHIDPVAHFEAMGVDVPAEAKRQARVCPGCDFRLDKASTDKEMADYQSWSVTAHSSGLLGPTRARTATTTASSGGTSSSSSWTTATST